MSQLWDEKPDRHIELGLTLAIGFFALVQLIVSYNNNSTTAAQTDQLISASKISAYAATQNLQAARNFAYSASRINEGILGAVSDLQDQADATQSAANTAASSLALSKDALTSVQRRRWSNSGNTPARHAMVSISFHPSWIRESQPNRSNTFDGVNPTYIAPHESTSSGSYIVSWEQLHQISAGKASFTEMGAVRYRDVFEGTKEHITRFCYSLSVVNNSKDADTLGFAERACPEGNCTDDDCKVK